MATAMDKDITREMAINGTEVNISMGLEGLTYRPKGRQKSVTISHEDILAAVEMIANAEGNKDTLKFFKEFNLI